MIVLTRAIAIFGIVVVGFWLFFNILFLASELLSGISLSEISVFWFLELLIVTGWHLVVYSIYGAFRISRNFSAGVFLVFGLLSTILWYLSLLAHTRPGLIIAFGFASLSAAFIAVLIIRYLESKPRE